MAAAITRAAPRFAIVECSSSLLLSQELFKAKVSTLVIEADQSSKTLTFNIPGDLSSAFHDLQTLSLLMNAMNGPVRVTSGEVMAFGSLRFELDDRLLCLPRPEHLTSQLTVHQCIHELCRLSSLIYLHVGLRDFSPRVAVLKFLKIQFMELYNAGEISSYRLGRDYTSELQPEVLLWVLCMCGTLWLDAGEKSWFASRISGIVIEVGLETWQEVENLLVKFLWMRGMCAGPCRPLWSEVELLIGSNAIMQGRNSF